MTDILVILAAIISIYFILKIAFKVLKLALILGVIAIVIYYLTEFGFLARL